MQKFLMAAALLAVVACGDKAKHAADSADSANAMAPVPPPAMVMDSAQLDSVKKDSIRKDSIAKADSAKPPAQ